MATDRAAAPARPAKDPKDRRSSSVDQRSSSVDQGSSPGDQRPSPVDERLVPLELGGLRLDQADAAQLAAVREAFLAHGVLFIR